MATKNKPAPKKKSAPQPSRPVKKAANKPAPAKPVSKKPAPKAPAKKTAAAPKAPAKKAPAPAKAAPKKPAPKAPAKKAPAAKPEPKKIATFVAPPPKVVKPARAFSAEELASFRSMLQQQIELVQGNLNALAGDNLKLSPMDSTGDISSHSTHMADHGTDNFDRELSLSLASSCQNSLYEIEDAIRRIDEGEYGACEACGGAIERPRLKALPFAKKCMACQNAAERGRGRHQPFRNNNQMQALGGEEASEPSDA